MAKRSKSRSLALARRPSVKPIVIRTTKVVKAKKHHRRGAGRAGGLFSKHNITVVGSGFAVGMLEKMAFVQNLPSLPVIGKTGTIAVAAYLLSGGRQGMALDVATSAAAIAGYMLGNQGSIVGDGADPYGATDGYVAGTYAGW
jgi:hypothetical protein